MSNAVSILSARAVPTSLHADLSRLAESSARWDRMAEALMRRDYAEFDRIRDTPSTNPKEAGPAQ